MYSTTTHMSFSSKDQIIKKREKEEPKTKSSGAEGTHTGDGKTEWRTCGEAHVIPTFTGKRFYNFHMLMYTGSWVCIWSAKQFSHGRNKHED